MGLAEQLAALVLVYIIAGIVLFVFILLGLWGLYQAGKAQERMASLQKKTLEMVQYQTDYAERACAAAEASAQAMTRLADRAERPVEVVHMQS